MLHKNAVANVEASMRGGVVLGLTSPAGPTATLDVVIGQVRSEHGRARVGPAGKRVATLMEGAACGDSMVRS